MIEKTDALKGMLTMGLVLALMACARGSSNTTAANSPVTTVLSSAMTSRVPATAPDSVPTALWDSLIAPANIITDPPGITGSYIRDLVLVQFVDGATQTDRQAAIDAVHGTVVGGMTIGGPENFYVVRLPYKLMAGDSTSGPMLRAVDLLDANPKVAVAIVADMDPLVAKGNQARNRGTGDAPRRVPPRAETSVTRQHQIKTYAASI